MIIVGLDLSLTKTGWARIDTDVPATFPDAVTVGTITSKGKADATLHDRHWRLKRIASEIDKACDYAELIVVESPAQHQTTGHHHDRSGLWWLVVDNAIGNSGYGPVEVGNSQLKKYATGKGNASKDAVLAAVIRRYPSVDVTGNDEADALVLAAMGSRRLGYPIEHLPAVNLEAMVKIDWPVIA